MLVVAAAVAAVVAAGAGYLLGRGDTAPAAAEDPGLVHVHGLGVNPADGLLYAAAHTGLFRVDDDGTAERIGDRYQDTMGFTVAGADRFVASGHPDLRDRELQVEGKRPLLGLIESTDRGRTWQPMSLLGDADLHTITVVGSRVVAYDSTGERLLASDDGGQSWQTRSQIALIDFALDPADADQVVAVATDGSVQASGDGGRTWTAQPAPPMSIAVLRWGASGLWAGAADGTLARYDALATWTPVYRFGGAVEAIALDGDSLYVAVDGAGIFRSRDLGRTWRPLGGVAEP